MAETIDRDPQEITKSVMQLVLNNKVKGQLARDLEKLCVIANQHSSCSINLVDITGPQAVQVDIRHDERVVWVNVDGVCRFRACQITQLEVNRPERDKDNGTDYGQGSIA